MRWNPSWQIQSLHNASSVLAMVTKPEFARTKLFVEYVVDNMRGEHALFLSNSCSQGVATAKDPIQLGLASAQNTKKQLRKPEKHGSIGQASMRYQALHSLLQLLSSHPHPSPSLILY